MKRYSALGVVVLDESLRCSVIGPVRSVRANEIARNIQVVYVDGVEVFRRCCEQQRQVGSETRQVDAGAI